MIMIAILVIYLIAGSLMDMFPVLAVTLPIFFPIVLALGFDPLQFGVMCILMIMMGGITPPFGLQVFAIGGLYREVPTYRIFRGCMPFLGSMIICLLFILFVPEISTMLPDYMIPYR